MLLQTFSAGHCKALIQYNTIQSQCDNRLAKCCVPRCHNNVTRTRSCKYPSRSIYMLFGKKRCVYVVRDIILNTIRECINHGVVFINS